MSGTDATSRFLFLPMPAHGHLNPTLPVAADLVARGHEVTYLLPGEFRDVVTATGAALVEYEGRSPEPPRTAADGGTAFGRVFEQLMAIAKDVAVPLLDLHDRLRPDVVVGEAMSLWSGMLAAARPVTTVQLSTSYVMGCRGRTDGRRRDGARGPADGAVARPRRVAQREAAPTSPPDCPKRPPSARRARYRLDLRVASRGVGVVDIGFDVDGLRRAGDGHRSSAAAAAALSGLLTGIALDARALGTVPHAAAFHGAVVTARDTQARDALQESTRREDGAGRTDAAAGFGASLVTLTTDVARSAAPPGLPLSVAPPGGG